MLAEFPPRISLISVTPFLRLNTYASRIPGLISPEYRLLPPVIIFSFIEERLPIPLENKPGSVICETALVYDLLLPEI
jgi:hypothetical protein